METTAKKNDLTDIKTAGVKSYQTTVFKPRPTLLLDVLPEVDSQTKSMRTDEKAIGQAGDKPQEMLETLLMNAETYALKTQKSKMGWQLATLITGTLLVSAGLLIGLMTYETNTGGAQKGRLEVENQTLKSQVKTASERIASLNGEIENLKNRNVEFAAAPRSIATTAAPAATVREAIKPANDFQKKAAVAKPGIDTSRIEAIRKGKYPVGASKTELMTVLGRPDRIYAARNYEQLVYFGRKPGRFWFIGERLTQATE